jgi:syntaxin 1B/2/3
VLTFIQLKSNRRGHAQQALTEVRARHNELQRIEQTLTELAAIFADMAQIVAYQEDDVVRTEINADKTATDVDLGNTQMDKGIEHARRRRRNKWWCLLVVVLIILAIALGIGLGIGLPKATSGNKTK